MDNAKLMIAVMLAASITNGKHLEAPIPARQLPDLYACSSPLVRLAVCRGDMKALYRSTMKEEATRLYRYTGTLLARCRAAKTLTTAHHRVVTASSASLLPRTPPRWVAVDTRHLSKGCSGNQIRPP
ncbi:hypothetical protein CLAFUW4_20024 [Fulvia fulva]|uniref:uncharacterized protein n=1 Tax=Passalora fulva TaxID=5499 RepID=UPI002852B76A|nr:uncharacterized protein CLAFUR5_20024 [Fulvia fulva]KAK4628712.1 hypothetical protein CLAFUR4_20024 [Fulvia fulva]KAK4630170.1 hypothetical protein CLAFUR0_20024 [Fulvia fulva]WMI38820.1 hypothetical protein CLAFUR5_20024 [Fulvia fulva]WPV12186.1 hypothetical protein CLAFUW4_20024 [Fulvia fulva]WPV27888.1 hypothetical protein CLAFUW7_20024 [Fulvia fulva]